MKYTYLFVDLVGLDPRQSFTEDKKKINKKMQKQQPRALVTSHMYADTAGKTRG